MNNLYNLRIKESPTTIPTYLLSDKVADLVDPSFLNSGILESVSDRQQIINILGFFDDPCVLALERRDEK